MFNSSHNYEKILSFISSHIIVIMLLQNTADPRKSEKNGVNKFFTFQATGI